MWSLKQKAFANLFWFLNIICNLEQLIILWEIFLTWLKFTMIMVQGKEWLKTKVSWAQLSFFLVFYVFYPETF